jgi:Uma2 family endonuclease
MIATQTLERLSVADYLAYERESDCRHELVDGYLYAMSGASDRHEEIAANLVAALHQHLRSSGCRVYESLDPSLNLPSIGLDLPLSEIYA